MYYFAKFDETGEIDSISISEYKNEEETANSYYVSQEECLHLKAQIAEKIKEANESNDDILNEYENLIKRNADLEKENAALLFTTLTGESFNDI